MSKETEIAQELPEVETTESKNSNYLKGDFDLIRTLEHYEAIKADGGRGVPLDVLDQQIDMLKRLMSADINLRTRIVGAVSETESHIDTVLASGHVVNEVHLPYGMHKSPCDIIASTKQAVVDYANEVAPATDMADVVNNIMSPVAHRLALAEIALLKLRQFFSLNVHHLPPRSAAILGDLVADAEALTNGTYPSYLARLQGYKSHDWNFKLLECSKEGDLTPRFLFVFADGIEMPVVAYAFIDIMQTEQGTGAMVDYSILQMITADRRVIPARSVGCWRVATDEEVASGAFKSAKEVYEMQHTAYVQINAQVEAQEAAAKKAAEQAKNTSAAGLILPDSAKEGGGKLILPN